MAFQLKDRVQETTTSTGTGGVVPCRCNDGIPHIFVRVRQRRYVLLRAASRNGYRCPERKLGDRHRHIQRQREHAVAHHRAGVEQWRCGRQSCRRYHPGMDGFTGSASGQSAGQRQIFWCEGEHQDRQRWRHDIGVHRVFVGLGGVHRGGRRQAYRHCDDERQRRCNAGRFHHDRGVRQRNAGHARESGQCVGDRGECGLWQ